MHVWWIESDKKGFLSLILSAPRFCLFIPLFKNKFRNTKGWYKGL